MFVSDNVEWVEFAEAKNIDGLTDALFFMEAHKLPFTWRFAFDRKPVVMIMSTYKEHKKAALIAIKSIRRANYVRKL